LVVTLDSGYRTANLARMLEVRMWPEEHTRTPEKSCYYVAETTIDGVVYRGRSRMSASNELARVLVAAGIPDASMRVEQIGIAGYLIWKSSHRAALWTYQETATIPLHRVQWVDPAFRSAQMRSAFAKKEGGTDEPAIPVPETVSDE